MIEVEEMTRTPLLIALLTLSACEFTESGKARDQVAFLEHNQASNAELCAARTKLVDADREEMNSSYDSDRSAAQVSCRLAQYDEERQRGD